MHVHKFTSLPAFTTTTFLSPPFLCTTSNKQQKWCSPSPPRPPSPPPSLSAPRPPSPRHSVCECLCFKMHVMGRGRESAAGWGREWMKSLLLDRTSYGANEKGANEKGLKTNEIEHFAHFSPRSPCLASIPIPYTAGSRLTTSKLFVFVERGEKERLVFERAGAREGLSQSWKQGANCASASETSERKKQRALARGLQHPLIFALVRGHTRRVPLFLSALRPLMVLNIVSRLAGWAIMCEIGRTERVKFPAFDLNVGKKSLRRERRRRLLH